MSQGFDPQTGKRRRHWETISGTRKEAERRERELLTLRDQGVDVPTGRLTLGEFLDRWLTSYAEPAVAPKTFRRYSELVHLHLVPCLGSIPLGKLRGLQIQECYQSLLDKLSARTVVQDHRVLREALSHAVKWNLLSRNPADAAEPPRPSRFEPTILEPHQIKTLLETAKGDEPLATLAYVSLMTGLRLSETLGLRWGDVDLERGTIHVNQTCQWLPRQGFTFRQPKSHRSSRAVAISAGVVKRLRDHRERARQANGPVPAWAFQDRGLVFCNPLGEPLHPSWLKDAWKRLLKRAGLPHRVRWHDLRHSHASLMLANGTHPKIVSERLGHASIGITLDTYSHVLPGLQREAADDLEKLIASR